MGLQNEMVEIWFFSSHGAIFIFYLFVSYFADFCFYCADFRRNKGNSDFTFYGLKAESICK